MAIVILSLLMGSSRTFAENESGSFIPGNFPELVKRVSGAVLNISTSRVVDMGNLVGPPGNQNNEEWQEFLDKYFGKNREKSHGKQQSLGTGFIIDPKGYIVTNHHVVAKADDIQVSLSDNRKFKAKLIGSDQKTDLALIKIDTKETLPFVTFGNSDALDIGQWVLAIGNPFGLGHTVTAGIVSAKGRVLNLGPYDDFIQTDASINPGNSGGPLFNLKGEVVGINTAIVASGQGIGFAIPAKIAQELIPQLKDTGKVIRGWLGVYIQKVSPELADAFSLKNAEGALVSQVMDKSPAKEAGIKSGDIITRFDGKKIVEMNDLPRLVASTPINKKVSVDLVREGKNVTIPVTITQLKDEIEPAVESKKEKEDTDKLGLSLQEVTPDSARQMKLKTDKGLWVRNVEEGSPSDEAGIHDGDVIVEVNREAVHTLKDFKKAIKKDGKKENILVLLYRNGSSIFVTVKKPSS